MNSSASTNKCEVKELIQSNPVIACEARQSSAGAGNCRSRRVHAGGAGAWRHQPKHSGEAGLLRFARNDGREMSPVFQTQWRKPMSVKRPTLEQMTDIVDSFGMNMTQERVAEFLSLMEGNFSAYDLVDQMPDEIPV